VSFEFEAEELAGEPQLPAVEADALLDLPLRVWAELGRARMGAARIVGMAPGTIVDLDHAPEDPADIYVNGTRFGTGRLLLVDGEWAIRIESIERPDPDIEQTSSDGSAS
jgi:flagellar motor switch protein FliN